MAWAPNHSPLIRPLRQLFDEGKPAGNVIVIGYEFSANRRLPMAALCARKDHSVVLWPALPPNVSALRVGDAEVPFDHVTLDLRNERTHITGFDPGGNRQRSDLAKRLGDPSETGARLWFWFAIRTSVLDQQCGEFEGEFHEPERRDKGRREQEYRDYAQRILERLEFLPVPTPLGDYVVTAFYLLPQRRPDWMTPKSLPMGSFWNDEIDGWPDGSRFDVSSAAIELDSINIGIATACPSGRLRSDVVIGLID